MGVPRFCAVVLCFGILINFTRAVVVFTENGRIAEENVGKFETEKTREKSSSGNDLFRIPPSTFKNLHEEDGESSSGESSEQRSEEAKNSEMKYSDERSISMGLQHGYNLGPLQQVIKSLSTVDSSSSEESNSDISSDEILSSEENHFKSSKRLQKRSSPNSKSSSEESSSLRKANKKSSEESSESSDESKIKKIIKKRSLDSDQDSLNTISKLLNETNPKDNNGIENGENLPASETTLNTEPTTVTTYIEENNQEASTSSLDINPSTERQVEEVIEGETNQTTAKDEETQPTTVKDEETQTSEQTETSLTEGTSTKGETERTTTEKEVTEIESDTTEEEPHTTTEAEPTSTSTTTESSESDSLKEETEEEPSSISTSGSSTEVEEPKPEDTLNSAIMRRVDKLSDQIRLVLFEFRKTNVVAIPGQHFFPDPMPLQDFEENFSLMKMKFKNMRIYGLSNFTVEHINTDVDRMQVYCLLHMKRLVVLGDYTMSSFWSRGTSGPFNVTLLGVDSEGVAEVTSAVEGYLEALDSNMDMFAKDIKLDFKNIGFYFQTIASSVGDIVFNSIKPQILEKVNVVIRNDVNKKLKEFSVKFINKVAPVDLAISEGRKYVKTNGYDPFHTKDRSFLLGGLIMVNITEFWLEGLSRFYRIGNLSLSMDKGTIEIGVHVATEQLKGGCGWSGETFGIVKFGKTNFTVHHIQVRVLVTQSLDIRKKPQLEDLDIEMGYVRVTMDSPLTLNMMIENVINTFPRLIRHIIVDALEQPLKEKIQEILNKINMESVVEENLPRLDSFGL